jgi:rod shape-determining protein MreC
MQPTDPRRSRVLLGFLVLASLTIITVDARRDASGSPVDPLRTATSEVLGPVEAAASSLARPIGAIPRYFGDVRDLRRRDAQLEAANAALREKVRAAEANIHRSAELQRIGAFASRTGYSIARGQVVAMGPAQTFTRTVTVDVGTNDGVRPNQTVINADGLVGRVIRATPDTSTVLLIIDGKSVVGGRLTNSMELGLLTGNGDLSGNGGLKLSLVDHTVSPRRGDVVVTWGSRRGAPYLPGIPVGTVVSVHSSPAELTQTAEVRPYVDFSSLDVVGIITGSRAHATSPSASNALTGFGITGPSNGSGRSSTTASRTGGPGR